MTAEFGPLDDDTEIGGGIINYCGGQLIRLTCVFFTQLGEGHIRYQPTANRLSLHGESDKAGSAFRAGGYVMWAMFASLMMGLGMVWALAELAGVIAGTGWASVALLLFGAGGGVCGLAIVGVLKRITAMEVYDHTVPKPDDRIDKLADNYVGGDLDHEEFEQEVETVFEREAER